MCDGGVLMVGTSEGSLQFSSSPVQEQGLLCQTPEKRQVCKWCGGSVEAHGETSVVSNMLSLSWEDSWLISPWPSSEISSSPCSYTNCASFALSSLGLVGLKALQILPDGRIVPEAGDNTGSEQKAVSPGLTLAKHCLFFSGCVEIISVIVPLLPGFFFLFHTHNGCFCPHSLTWECGCSWGCTSSKNSRNTGKSCVNVRGPVFAERLHTSLHGSTGEPPGSCEVFAGEWSQPECSHRGEILGEEPVALLVGATEGCAGSCHGSLSVSLSLAGWLHSAGCGSPART